MNRAILSIANHGNQETENSKQAQAHFGMLIWALIVGSSFPAVVAMTEGLPPLLLTAIRFVIAAVAIAPLFISKSQLRPSLTGLALYLIMGLSLAGFFGAMFWAAHQSSALSMATLYVSVPLLAYFLGLAFRVEKSSIVLLAILALGGLGALGLAWAESGGQPARINFGFAELIYFLGCIASALYPVLSKWGLARGILSPSAEVRTFWSLVSGAVLIGLIGLLLEDPRELSRMKLTDSLLLVYLAVFSSGLTFWLTQRATSVLTPGSVTAYSYLIPFVSMLLLFFQQPQQIGWHWLPGSLLVTFAMFALFYRDTAYSFNTRSIFNLKTVLPVRV